MERIKIFGERNTATNALKQLIEGNSASRALPSIAPELNANHHAHLKLIRRLPRGHRLSEAYIDFLFRRAPVIHAWKHAATIFDTPEAFAGVHVVFCVRAPASWLLALHRKPYQALRPVPEELGAFLRADWQTVGRDRLGGIRCRPAELYNRKLRSYLGFMAALDRAGADCSVVKFEDFVIDQRPVFEALRPHLSAPAQTPAIVEGNTKKDPTKDRAWYRDYYARNLWAKDIDAATMDLIRAEIDWEAAGRFGYSRDL